MAKDSDKPASRGRRWLFVFFNMAVTAGAIYVALSYVYWDDRIVDQRGRQAVIVSENGQALIVRFVDPGVAGTEEPTSLDMDAVDRRIPGVLTMFRRTRVPLLILGVVIDLVVSGLAALRWAVLLRRSQPDITSWQTFVWSARGTVIDAIGAGQLGSDAYRLYSASSAVGVRRALGVQVLERVLGLVALGLLVLAGASFGTGVPSIGWSLPSSIVSVGTGAAIILVCLVTIYRTGFRPWKVNSDGPDTKRPAMLMGALQSELTGSSLGLPLLVALALSVSIHAGIVLYYFFLSSSLGLPLPFTSFLVAIPIVTLLLVLPVTIAGIGVFEGAMVLLLTGSSSVVVGEVLILCALHRLLFVGKRLLLAGAFWIPNPERRRMVST